MATTGQRDEHHSHRHSQTQEHDKPKSEVRCCSILAPGDEYYHVKFTKCRYKMINEPCQYMCNNEAT